MAEFPHFAGEPIWLVTVVGTGADAAIPVTVNGITMKVQRATPTRMPEPFKIALEDGGYSISALPEIKDEMAIDPLGEEGLSAGAGELRPSLPIQFRRRGGDQWHHSGSHRPPGR